MVMNFLRQRMLCPIRNTQQETSKPNPDTGSNIVVRNVEEPSEKTNTPVTVVAVQPPSCLHLPRPWRR